MTARLDVVFFEVGGPIYGDRPYYEALLRAILEVRPDADEQAFWAGFWAAREDQRGPFTRRLYLLFLEEADVDRVVARGRELWHYEPEDLFPDVRPTLEALHGSYRLGVLANQEPGSGMPWPGMGSRASSTSGRSPPRSGWKPDPAIFEHASATPASRPADARWWVTAWTTTWWRLDATA